jgi:hypothetical protein
MKKENLFAEISIENAKKGLYEKGEEKLCSGDILGGIFKINPEAMKKLSS